uniref:Extracellular globin n=1 Tax=Platynereis dumerilii TaxID=6359 RepID=A0A7T8CM06_PLADU|nr:extracellular globin Egb_A1d_beta [Platynereis dumerilii]
MYFSYFTAAASYLSVAVLVLSCLVQGILGEEVCGPLEKIKVQHQWASAYRGDHDRLKMSTLVWKDFFAHNPEERARFERVHSDDIYSGDFRAHMVRVFAGFDLLIGALNQEDIFRSAMIHYTKMHKKLGVTYEIGIEFGKSIGRVLPEFIDGKLDITAWRPCYKLIATGVDE